MQSASDGVARVERAEEASQLAKAVDASEAEARGEDTDVPTTSSTSSADPTAKKTTEYSWWDVLLGKHDHDIFQRAATGEHSAEEERKRDERDEQIRKRRKRTSSVVAGIEHLMPRFWVLTDHARKQVVLVFRGTMSLNEIAVDLTCDPEEFEPAQTRVVKDEDGDEELVVPGMFPGVPFPQREDKEKEKEGPRKYMVHGGMLKMARAMGGKGKPVQLAVGNALMRNWEYDLVLCGHSLGAGVAGILGLMWADPETCLTVGESGLPRGRKVSVYCFAPPCLVDPQLSKLSSKLIVSLVYSHDVVSRLSLGSVRDLKNAAMWLCEGEEDGKGEGAKGVLKRVESMKRAGGEEDLRWYIALRKTLEANMHMADLFPPGRVLWALRDSDLHVKHRSHGGGDKLRLFEVLDVEKVFEQIVFARDMLSAHMPHQYDRVLHDLL
ncbi:hypothetical protein ONZ45_g7633 [Pleurotus djamor]|nr:hypothetical protein ONZ45_g7633 [Pleurotus djamor]